jgi:hypothetical protein
LLLGVAIAVVATFATASLFAVVAIGNDLALRDRPAAFSAFGPTDPMLPLAGCSGRIDAGPTARLELYLDGDVDQRSLGQATVEGARAGQDVRWNATVATSRLFGQVGIARIADSGWRSDGATWTAVDASSLATDTLDLNVLATALSPGDRGTFEDRGLEFIEGARSRHCRVAVDGLTFKAAFPEIEWFVGGADVHRWRGELDYWIFGDGQLGQVSGSVNGDAAGLVPGGILATIDVRLTATFRGAALAVTAPTQ